MSVATISNILQKMEQGSQSGTGNAHVYSKIYRKMEKKNVYQTKRRWRRSEDDQQQQVSLTYVTIRSEWSMNHIVRAIPVQGSGSKVKTVQSHSCDNCRGEQRESRWRLGCSSWVWRWQASLSFHILNLRVESCSTGMLIRWKYYTDMYVHSYNRVCMESHHVCLFILLQSSLWIKTKRLPLIINSKFLHSLTIFIPCRR